MEHRVSFTEPSLKGRALRLLGRREHSRAELEQNLKRFEEQPGALERTLDELQAKGLDPRAVTEALAGLQTSERARALEVWRKKFGKPAATPQDAAKQMRFLASRGFGGDVIRRVVMGDFGDGGSDS